MEEFFCRVDKVLSSIPGVSKVYDIPDYIGIGFRVSALDNVVFGQFKEFGKYYNVNEVDVFNKGIDEYLTNLKEKMTYISAVGSKDFEKFDFVGFDSRNLYTTDEVPSYGYRSFKKVMNMSYNILDIDIDKMELNRINKIISEIDVDKENRIEMYSLGKIKYKQGEIYVYDPKNYAENYLEPGEVLDYDSVELILDDPHNDYVHYHGFINENNIKKIKSQVVLLERNGNSSRAKPSVHCKTLTNKVNDNSDVIFQMMLIDETGAGHIPTYVPITILDNGRKINLLECPY